MMNSVCIKKHKLKKRTSITKTKAYTLSMLLLQYKNKGCVFRFKTFYFFCFSCPHLTAALRLGYLSDALLPLT